MSAKECPNPFCLTNHDENNQSLMKRVTALIQSHARTFGSELVVGDKICDKCRLFARHKHGQIVNSRKRRPKPKGQPQNNSAVAPKLVQSNASYLMPMSDSSNDDDSNDSNEPYSEKYHKQRALNENNTTAVDIQFDQYDDDSFNSTPKDNTSTSNENSNSLHTMATANPISEFKIVAVTSLPAEKHNEIMNNDDNAMNSTDSIYNHQLKISEIISTASNANVFGIAKKPSQTPDDSNSLLTPATTSHQQRLHMLNQPLKRRNTKIKNLKQRIQNSFRFPNIQGLKSDVLSSGTNKESTDSDEHSNSNLNSKLSRRKDTLQVKDLDCEMEFVELSPPKYQHRQAHMTNEQKLLSAQLETVKKIKNPNADLIRKVAFLRVCVNYMMTELEGEPFNFGKIITYENLKTKYNSKRLG